MAESFSPASLDGGGIGANATERAAAGHMVTWGSFGRETTIVHGLVPDGVKEVTLTATDGTTKTVAVHDNVYGTVLDGVFTSARFTGPNGKVDLGPFR